MTSPLETRQNYMLDNVLSDDVLRVFSTKQRFNTSNPGSLISYLSLQSNYYMKKDFSELTRSDLNVLYEAKNKISAYDKSTADSGRSSTGRGRAGQTAQEDISNGDIIFKGADGWDGYINIGSGGNNNWCGSVAGGDSLTKIRHSSVTRYDLACVTNYNTLFTSSYMSGSFTDPSAIAHTFRVIKSSVDSGDEPQTSVEVYETITNSRQIRFGDFDGDGKDEVLAVPHSVYDPSTGGEAYGYSMSIYIFSDKLSLEPYEWVARPGLNNNGGLLSDNWCNDFTNTPYIFLLINDFNGDGKDDLWCFNQMTGMHSLRFTVHNPNPGPLEARYSWNEPAFSLDGSVWCEGGDLRGGDFNGDGKSDVLCLSAGSVSIRYSLGDGRFVSALTSNYENSFNTWTENYIQNTGTQLSTSDRLITGDFDNNGFIDIMQIPSGYAGTKVLFNGIGKDFVNRTDSNTGQFLMNGMMSWCTSLAAVILSADFNGDGKSDVLCIEYINYPYTVPTKKLMLSKTKALMPLSIEIAGSVSVSNFQVGEIVLSSSDLYNLTYNKICNNKMIPDNTISCFVSTASSMPLVDKMSMGSWVRESEMSVKGEIVMSIQDNLIFNYNASGNIGTKAIPIKHTVSGISLKQSSIDVNIQESSYSSLTVLVNSGDCANISVYSKQSSLSIPYTAVASLSLVNVISDGSNIVPQEQFFSVARQIVEAPLRLDEATSEIQFDMAGQININLFLEGDNSVGSCL